MVFSVYDLLYMEIPDEVILPFLAILFIAISYDHFSGANIFGYYLPMVTPWLQPTLANAMLGTAIIFAFFFLQIVIQHLDRNVTLLVRNGAVVAISAE